MVPADSVCLLQCHGPLLDDCRPQMRRYNSISLENFHSDDPFDPVCDKLTKKYSKLKLKIPKSAENVKPEEDLHKLYKLQRLGSVRSHVD